MESLKFRIPLESPIEVFSDKNTENLVWQNSNGIYRLMRYDKSKTDGGEVAQGIAQGIVISNEALEELRTTATIIPVFRFKTHDKIVPGVQNKVLKYFASALNYDSTDRLMEAIGLNDNVLSVVAPAAVKLDAEALRWEEYRRRQIALMIITCFDMCQGMRTKDGVLKMTASVLGYGGNVILKQAVEVLSKVEFDHTYKLFEKYPKPQGFFI